MESGESRSAGYYCHKCNLTVQVPSTDLCPLCNDGFIEKLNPSSISSFADRNNEHREDMDSLPAVLRHVSDNFEVIVQGGDPSHGNLSDHRPSSSNRRDASSDAAQGNDRRRTRNQNYANSFEHVFSELLNTMTRPNAVNSDGNAPLFLLSNPPGDYAWGREGLDTIVTQLLNQMDSSGPPPLSTDKIDAIPFVVVTDAQVSENTQCSVCWESFKQAEPVRQLPCEHIYHDACILPWLQLHGTCPICRKLLCDDNDSRLGFSHSGNLEALFSNVQGFSIYPSRRRRTYRQRRNNTGVINHNIRCWHCSEFGHYARDCHHRNRNNSNNRSQPQQQSSQEPSQNDALDEVTAFAGPFIDVVESLPYVDIDELDEEDDDDDDEDEDLYDGYSHYTDYDIDCDSLYADFDLDVLSFSGASSGSTAHPSTGSGWPSLGTTTASMFGEAHPRRLIQCYRCGRYGHKAPECRVASADSRSALRAQPQRERCRYCARRNHASDKCFYRLSSNRGGVSGTSARAAAGRASAVGFSSETAINVQPSQQARLKSPPPPYPQWGTWSNHPVRPRAGILKKEQPSQRRLTSPPPPRHVTPPPALSASSSSSLRRSTLRGGSASGNNSAASHRSTSSTSGWRALPARGPICYRCHQPGHVLRDCTSENDMRECWRCGETGHLNRECPLLL